MFTNSLLLLLITYRVTGYSANLADTHLSRRFWLSSTTATAGWLSFGKGLKPGVAVQGTFDVEKDLIRLKLGLQQLTQLLDNWNEVTLNCNYAEVNRGLLATENKEELLDAASQSALFNKGKTTKTLCKRDAELVRSIMGIASEKRSKAGPPAMFASKGLYESLEQQNELNSARPLNGIDPIIERGFKVTEEPDMYIEAMERWSQAKSGLVAASYASGVADYGSIIAAEGGDGSGQGDADDPSYLESARKYCIAARVALKDIIRLLEPAELLSSG